MVGPDVAAIVNVILHDDLPVAVRRTDQEAQALDSELHLRTFGFVCRADAEDEPRFLPGPSGRPVAVTGLAWLPGLVRANFGAGDDFPGLPASGRSTQFWRAHEA